MQNVKEGCPNYQSHAKKIKSKVELIDQSWTFWCRSLLERLVNHDIFPKSSKSKNIFSRFTKQKGPKKRLCA